jgi:hypothetical protein
LDINLNKMKKIRIYIIALIGLAMSSCIKNDQITYTGSELEWDAATYNANAVGVTYPILTRVPGFGRAVLTSDPSITRTAGTITFRVNLVGPQSSSPITVTYTVLPGVTTAVSGTHYTTTGTFTIPANSSFGIVTVSILNPGATSGTVDLVLELVPPTGIIVNANDKDLGIRIAQS